MTGHAKITEHDAAAVEDPRHPGEWTARCPDCGWASGNTYWSPEGHSVQAAREAREHNRGER